MQTIPESLRRLAPAEKLQIIEDLWEQLSSSPEHVPVHEWQKLELDRRRARLQEQPESVVNWDEIKQRIRNRLD